MDVKSPITQDYHDTILHKVDNAYCFDEFPKGIGSKTHRRKLERKMRKILKEEIQTTIDYAIDRYVFLRLEEEK